MPATKSALLRYRIIDKCIRNKYKTYPSKEELRQACEDALFNSVQERVSISTIEKDLNAMRFDETLGYLAPIAFSREYKGYYYEDPNYSFDAIPLNDDDLEALRFAATTLHQFKGIKIFENFDFAIGKIFERINLSSESIDELSNYVQFESVNEIQGGEHLSSIVYAIQNRLVLKVEYQPFSKLKAKSYAVHPYLLKEYRNRWYLIGYDEKAQKVKTFGLDRTHMVYVSETKYKRNKEFNPESFFDHALGITVSNNEPIEVILSFNQSQGHYIKTQPIHQSQKIVKENSKEIRVQITVFDTFELTHMILGFGNSVSIKSPKKLIKKIKKIHQESINNQ